MVDFYWPQVSVSKPEKLSTLVGLSFFWGFWLFQLSQLSRISNFSSSPSFSSSPNSVSSFICFISSSNFLFQNWKSLESSKHQKNERTDRIGRAGKAGRAGEIGDPRELRELEEPCPQSVLLPIINNFLKRMSIKWYETGLAFSIASCSICIIVGRKFISSYLVLFPSSVTYRMTLLSLLLLFGIVSLQCNLENEKMHYGIVCRRATQFLTKKFPQDPKCKTQRHH